jgi:hypothetical protein
MQYPVCKAEASCFLMAPALGKQNDVFFPGVGRHNKTIWRRTLFPFFSTVFCKPDKFYKIQKKKTLSLIYFIENFLEEINCKPNIKKYQTKFSIKCILVPIYAHVYHKYTVGTGTVYSVNSNITDKVRHFTTKQNFIRHKFYFYQCSGSGAAGSIRFWPPGSGFVHFFTFPDSVPRFGSGSVR